MVPMRPSPLRLKRKGYDLIRHRCIFEYCANYSWHIYLVRNVDEGRGEETA